MSFEVEILDAGIELLESIADRPPTAWPYVKPTKPFPPSDATLWWEVRFAPNQPDDLVWDSDAMLNVFGAFRIMVHSLLDIGPAAYDEAARVANLIPKGTAIGPVRVSTRPTVGSPYHIESATICTLTIPYEGIIKIPNPSP